ncbi:MAG TPA: ABC transporter permease [Pseudonocardia sp.]
MNYFGWLFDAANWTDQGGVFQRLLQHIGYTALTMAIAMVLAVPLGAWIGHTGRGGFLVVGLANGLRALPTLGLLVLLVGAIGIGLIGPLIALVILAVPPILAGTYAGVRNVDSAVVDAARGMGMRGRDVLFRVELPNALPLVVGGIRSSTLQVISTATIAAYVALGGLGRFIVDGLAIRDFPEMIGGSILVAALAIAADLLLAALQKTLVSPGLQTVPSRGRRLRAVPDPRPASQAA